MKIKFIISIAYCHAKWSYYNKDYKDKRLSEFRDRVITNEHADAFINGDIYQATQFDSYEEAENVIKSFGEISHEKREADKIIKEYLGVGIYKIDKIFIHELP